MRNLESAKTNQCFFELKNMNLEELHLKPKEGVIYDHHLYPRCNWKA